MIWSSGEGCWRVAHPPRALFVARLLYSNLATKITKHLLHNNLATKVTTQMTQLCNNFRVDYLKTNACSRMKVARGAHSPKNAKS
jgi:hypothetical protein